MEPWFWAIVLLFAGLSLAMLEAFIPSGGILGFLSGCSIVGAVVMAFMQGPGVGLAVSVGAMLGVPAALVVALKLWPHTPIGRRILLKVPSTDDVMPDDPRQRDLEELVDQVGHTKCEMLPSGAVVIGGRTINAVSEGMPIDAGQSVRVIEVHGNRVVVRAMEGEAISADNPNPLARPVDTVIPDPFDESEA